MATEGVIRCEGRKELLATWVFGVTFVLVAWFFVVAFRADPVGIDGLLEAHVLADLAVAAAALLTPLALWGVWGKTRDWLSLGSASFQSDPWPAGVGGEVAGTIELAVRPHALGQAVVCLQCVRLRRTTSGRNVSWVGTVLWDREGRPVVSTEGRGTRLMLRFPLPEDALASSRTTTERVEWQLHLQAEVKGRSSHRSFTVPVEPLGRPGAFQDCPPTPSRPATVQLPARWLRETTEGGRSVFVFPAWRNLGLKLGFALFGLATTGLVGGVMLWQKIQGRADDLPMLLPVAFLGVTFLLVLPLFWLPVSLRVAASRDGLEVHRYWGGLPMGRQSLERYEIEGLQQQTVMQIQQRNKRRQVFYRLVAVAVDGRRVRCGGSIPGQSAIALYEARLKQALGID